MNKNLKLDISEVDDKGFQLVKFIGEFDKVGYDNVRSELNSLVESFSANVLIFDLAQLRFINSEGIGVMMDVSSILSQNSKKLVIVAANNYVNDIFTTMGINDVVESYSDFDSFLNSN